MHGAPLSRHNNLDLLRGADFGALELDGDAVLHIDSAEVFYFSDTGGAWNMGPEANLRDRLGSSRQVAPEAVPGDSPEFRDLLCHSSTAIYISTHPERWAYNLTSAVIARSKDIAANAAKRVLRQIR